MEATAGIINTQTSPPILTEEALLRLLTDSPIIKYQLTGMMLDTFAKKTDLQAILDRIDAQGERFEKQGERIEALREDFNRQFAEHTKRMDHFAEVQVEHSKRMDALREDFNQGFALLSKKIDTLDEKFNTLDGKVDTLDGKVNTLDGKVNTLDGKVNTLDEKFDTLDGKVDTLSTDVKKVDSHLGAIGARWGLESERAFREGLSHILAQETSLRVANYLKMDTEGFVFRRPDQVEIDVVVQNGEHTLIEIKSSVNRSDVHIFTRKVEFYEREESVKVKRTIIISPMFGPRAKDLADELGIETFASVYDVNK